MAEIHGLKLSKQDDKYVAEMSVCKEIIVEKDFENFLKLVSEKTGLGLESVKDIARFYHDLQPKP